MTDIEALFESLDLDGDGELSRDDLGRAARRQGWGWPQAPLHAVLDHLTTGVRMPRAAFVALMGRLLADRRGPFGEVLLGSPLHAGARIPGGAGRGTGPDVDGERVAEALEESAGAAAADDYRGLIRSLEGPRRLSTAAAALLIIDPQRAFTRGSWMRSFGPGGEREVAPIQAAFDGCAARVRGASPALELLFSRCPFPPDSYGWDDGLARLLGRDQLYVVKPGNSVLRPATNGFRQWLDGLAARGKTALVVGGCTLNSCVRVSAGDIARLGSPVREVIVDMSLCGARAGNYRRSGQFGGRSSVAAAVAEMIDAGVGVVPGVAWGDSTGVSGSG